MADRYSPTVRKRALGIELRRLRNNAGLTLEAAGEELGIDPTHLGRMETAHRGISKAQLRALFDIYDAPAEQREALLVTHSTLRQPAWWQGLGVPAGTFVDLEAEATDVRSWDLGLVSGLLQTEAYATASLRGLVPDMPDTERERRVSVRMQRGELLDKGLRLWSIVDEAALRRTVGGPGVMAEQLEFLAERTELPQVTVQVLPLDAGEHSGMEGSFALLDYEEHPPLGYTEWAGEGAWIEKEAAVTDTRKRWERLLSTALKPDKSVRTIRTFAREMRRNE